VLTTLSAEETKANKLALSSAEVQSHKMKKILILAYDFPPYISVGGLRPNAWFKYFKEFGFHPVVATRQWSNTYGDFRDYIAPSEHKLTQVEELSNGTIIRAPYFPNWSNQLILNHGDKKWKLLRKAYSASVEYGQFLLPIGPKRTIYNAAKEYLTNNTVDIILATGDPFVMFHYANKLSREFNIPWMADYRDPWTLNSDEKKSWLEKKIQGYLEQKIVSNATSISTVSEFVHYKIEQVVKSRHKSFIILPNGYDDAVINKVQKIPQSRSELTISFVGSLYEWHPYEHFLKTCAKFLEQNNHKIKFKFYGTNRSKELENLVQHKFPVLINHVEVIGKMPNEQLLEELAKDNVMLLFNYYSYMGTKIFDYIGIKRKILLCFTGDREAQHLKSTYYNVNEQNNFSGSLQADLIGNTKSGVCVKDASELLIILDELYEEFSISNEIKCNSIHIDNHSRRNYVKVLSDFINKNETND
jgi:glycosyltransferase involved in cell wall biosynthesis